MQIDRKNVDYYVMGKSIHIPVDTAKQKTDVQVQVNVDVVQILIALGTITSILIGWTNRNIFLRQSFREIGARLKPKDLELERSLESLLTKMLAVSDADRVVVALFTNRTSAYTFPFRYFSIFWEATDEATASIKEEYQNHPLDKKALLLEQCFTDWDNFLFTKKSFNIPEESKRFFINNGVEVSLSRLIGDPEKGFAGILMLHYNKDVSYPSEVVTSKLEDLYLILEGKIDMMEKKNTRFSK